MNLILYLKKVYENFIPPRTMKNEPKTNPKRTQFKPNSLKDKSNATFCVAKAYDNNPPRPTRKNEPKTNPKRTQFKPNSPITAKFGWGSYNLFWISSLQREVWEFGGV